MGVAKEVNIERGCRRITGASLPSPGAGEKNTESEAALDARMGPKAAVESSEGCWLCRFAADHLRVGVGSLVSRARSHGGAGKSGDTQGLGHISVPPLPAPATMAFGA